MHRARRRLLTSVAFAGVGGLVAAAPLTAAAAPAGARLAGSASGFATPGALAGSADPRGTVDFEVLLAMRNPAGADATIRAVSTPGGPRYGRYLSGAQFRAGFAPTTRTVTSVSRWLRSVGFTVTGVAESRMYVAARGSVSTAERAFGTRIDNYRVRGKVLRGVTTDLTIPASLAGAVAGVTDLDDSMALVHPAGAADAPPPGVRYGVQPCSAYYGQKIATDKPKAYGKHQPYVVCGYVPSQYRSAYGIANLVANGYDGKGQTVVITDAYASPTMRSDIDTYSRRHGLPALKPGQYREVLPSSFDRQGFCDPGGWYGEETLDVDSVHGMAPGANITYVGGSNCEHGLTRAWAGAIDKHLGSIITNSWTVDGLGTEFEARNQGYLRFVHQYAQEAAMTGIGLYFSSGDSGDQVGAIGARSVDIPAADPYVTAVGGVSVFIGRDGSRLAETGWENSYSTLAHGAWTPSPPGVYSSGSGGGTSRVYAQPSYQRGIVPTSISEYFRPVPHRALPDISMPADPNTGLLIGETQTFPSGVHYAEYRLGGTSLASPLLAGVMAVADQYAGHPHGFANPAFYALAGTPAIYDDRTPAQPIAEVRTDYTNFLNGSQGTFFRLRTADARTTIYTRPGYDDVTGIGSPGGAAFIRALAR